MLPFAFNFVYMKVLGQGQGKVNFRLPYHLLPLIPSFTARTTTQLFCNKILYTILSIFSYSHFHLQDCSVLSHMPFYHVSISLLLQFPHPFLSPFHWKFSWSATDPSKAQINVISHLPFSCCPCSTNQVYQIINVEIQIFLMSPQMS